MKARRLFGAHADAEGMKAARAALGDRKETEAHLTVMAAADPVLRQALVTAAISDLARISVRTFEAVARTGGLYRAVHDDGGET